jgi:outer membrane biogenesis lipoprotein LolB
LPLRFQHTDGGVNQCGQWLAGDPAPALAAAGLTAPPLSHYSLRAKRKGWVFGFTAFDHAEIKAAWRRLAARV